MVNALKDIETRVYQARGLGRTRRETADCKIAASFLLATASIESRALGGVRAGCLVYLRNGVVLGEWYL